MAVLEMVKAFPNKTIKAEIRKEKINWLHKTYLNLYQAIKKNNLKEIGGEIYNTQQRANIVL